MLWLVIGYLMIVFFDFILHNVMKNETENFIVFSVEYVNLIHVNGK